MDWAAELPSHWVIARLKWVCRRYSGGTPDKTRPEFWQNGTIPWLNSGAVNERRITAPSAYITQEAFANSSAKWIPPGALVMALAGQGKTKGTVAQLMFESTCNQSMAAIVPHGVEARFLYWWLVGNYQNIRNMAGGDLRDGLNLELLGAIPCPLAPLSEQAAIACFLDREVANIDALITEQERLIDLLREKSQAIVSETVTRGLKPEAPTRDSDTEWLGPTPAHWQVVRVKRILTSIEQGWSPQCESFAVNSFEEWGVLKVGCVNGGLFNPNENKKLPAEVEPIAGYSLKRGDLLVSRANTRELVGSAAVVAADFDHLLLCDKLYRLRLIRELCLPSFLAAYLGTKQARCQIELEATGASSSMLNISQGVLLDLLVPLPNMQEQIAILQFIEVEKRKLDAMTATAGRAIALLRERRDALVSAAVTGQIDVRVGISQPAVEDEFAA